MYAMPDADFPVQTPNGQTAQPVTTLPQLIAKTLTTLGLLGLGHLAARGWISVDVQLAIAPLASVLAIDLVNHAVKAGWIN